MFINALKQIPPEYLAGFPCVLVGSLAFFLSSYDWYWEEMMSGYYRRWNTPFGRLYTKFFALVGILGGLAIMSGFISRS